MNLKGGEGGLSKCTIYTPDFLLVLLTFVLDENIWEFEWKRLEKHSKKILAPVILLGKILAHVLLFSKILAPVLLFSKILAPVILLGKINRMSDLSP